MLVMHLKNFDVEICWIESLCRLLYKNGQKIDAETHIAGLDDGCVAGGGADFLFVFSRATRRTDDMHDARLRSKACKFHACRRAREIEDALRLGKDRQRIVGDCYAERADTGDFARIPAQKGELERSIAPTSFAPSMVWIVRIKVCPMRPPAPTTTRPISLFCVSPLIRVLLSAILQPSVR